MWAQGGKNQLIFKPNVSPNWQKSTDFQTQDNIFGSTLFFIDTESEEASFKQADLSAGKFKQQSA